MNPTPLPPQTELPQEPTSNDLWTANVRWFGWLLGCLALMGLLLQAASQARIVSVPFLVAITIAYLFDPLVVRLARTTGKRKAVVNSLFLLLVIVQLLLLVLFGPLLWRQLLLMPEKALALLDQLKPTLEQSLQRPVSTRSLQDWIEMLQNLLTQYSATSVAQQGGSALKIILGRTKEIVHVLVYLVLTPIFAFVLMRNFDSIRRQIHDLLPIPARPAIVAVLRRIDANISAFVRGQLMVGLALAVLYATALSLIELPLGMAIGLIVGVLNIIPYLGTIVGLLLATSMLLLNWQSVGYALLIYGTFAICHAIDGWLISPRILGNSVGLSPLIIVAAVLGFGEWFGFVGVLLAVPLTATVKILLQEALQRYRESFFYLGKAKWAASNRQIKA